jgi:hypothetical protein
VTIERAVLVGIGLVIGMAIVCVVVFVRAWLQGWRDYRSAEASGQMADSDLF